LSLRKKAAFSLVAVLLFFFALEVALRITGLGRPPVIGTLRFGYDTGIPTYDADGIEFEGEPFKDYPLFEAHPRLFWRPIPHTLFTGRDGLRNPVPPQHSKPPGAYRVGVIGDSCSFLGQRLYPERFAELAEQDLARPVEVINASCPGYTSFQGLRRLDDVWPWKPDLLVAYFGWNDHWNALTGHTDVQLAALNASRPIRGLVERLHTYEALSGLFSRPSPTRDPPATRTVRVPLADYRQNLEQIVTQAQEQKCPVILVTAATPLTPDQIPDWFYVFFDTYYQMSASEVAAIPDTHEQYNDVVRRVAEERGVPLLDLAKAWSQQPSDDRFRADLTHLTEKGHADAAQALYELWRQTRP
jgi:lysophospholipase L1-like esterase